MIITSLLSPFLRSPLPPSPPSSPPSPRQSPLWLLGWCGMLLTPFANDNEIFARCARRYILHYAQGANNRFVRKTIFFVPRNQKIRMLTPFAEQIKARRSGVLTMGSYDPLFIMCVGNGVHVPSLPPSLAPFLPHEADIPCVV